MSRKKTNNTVPALVPELSINRGPIRFFPAGTQLQSVLTDKNLRAQREAK